MKTTKEITQHRERLRIARRFINDSTIEDVELNEEELMIVYQAILRRATRVRDETGLFFVLIPSHLTKLGGYHQLYFKDGEVWEDERRMNKLLGLKGSEIF